MMKPVSFEQIFPDNVSSLLVSCKSARIFFNMIYYCLLNVIFVQTILHSSDYDFDSYTYEP